MWIDSASLPSRGIYMLEFLEAGNLEPHKSVQFPAIAIQFLRGLLGVTVFTSPFSCSSVRASLPLNLVSVSTSPACV